MQEVWIANPERRTVEVFRPDQPPVTYAGDESIASALLPGFAAQTSALFDGV